MNFGATSHDHTYPAIVVAGVYNKVYGIWRSIAVGMAQRRGSKSDRILATLVSPFLDVDGDKGDTKRVLLHDQQWTFLFRAEHSAL